MTDVAKYPTWTPSMREDPFWRVEITYDKPGGSGNVSLPQIHDEPTALAFFERLKADDALARDYVDRPGARVTKVQLIRYSPVIYIEDVTP